VISHQKEKEDAIWTTTVTVLLYDIDICKYLFISVTSTSAFRVAFSSFKSGMEIVLDDINTGNKIQITGNMIIELRSDYDRAITGKTLLVIKQRRPNYV
jgi:hypothetical protein